MSYDLIFTHDGTLLKTHHPRQCAGNTCCVHNPSNHTMIEFPQHWRSDRNLMERVCPHGVGHPDPDDIAYKRSIMGDAFADTQATHGCDGCCGGWILAPIYSPKPSLREKITWAWLAFWEWIKSFFVHG